MMIRVCSFLGFAAVAITVADAAGGRRTTQPKVLLRSSSKGGEATEGPIHTTLSKRRRPRKDALHHTLTTNRGGDQQVTAKKKAPSRLEVGFFFGLWYALNVAYNVENKKFLRLADLPWTAAVGQLAVGALYANFMWLSGLRAAPDTEYVTLARAALPIAAAHGAGQACTVLALGAGAVSSTHVIKALEPLFSAITSAVISHTYFHPLVYASLLPVVGGVAIAVAKDLSFSPLAFATAMASNALFAMRAVLSKEAMTTSSTLTSLSPASLFGVVTTVATVIMLPVALFFEPPFTVVMTRIKAAPASNSRLLYGFLASGLFHYLNNEVMYLTLHRVHPVTLAVGNTLKRIVLILASLVVLRETMAPLAAAGAAIAVAGTLAYALLKQKLS